MSPFAPQNLLAAQRAARREARLTGRTGADVDDLQQAAVLGLPRALEDWDPGIGGLPTWLDWCCRAAVRAELRRLRGPAPVVRARAAANPGASTPHEAVDDAREQRQRMAAVRRALRALPDRDREIFLRHFRDGETVVSLAAERGVTHQAVSERLRRMLAAVQREACSMLGCPLPGPRRSCSREALRSRRRRAERRAA